MLYVNTRDRTEVSTAYRTLCADTEKNGGLFAPFRLPVFSQAELRRFLNRSSGEIFVSILSVFFDGSIHWNDIGTIFDRQMPNTVQMSHRICIAELWHDPDHDYAQFEQSIYSLLSGKQERPTQWSRIAIRIAVLFAISKELKTKAINRFDISVTAEDETSAIAACYAKKMGLPIETIVYSCCDESTLWDLMNKCEILPAKTPQYQRTFLERLIYDRLGYQENKHYLDCYASKSTYQINEDQSKLLFDGLVVVVVGENRVQSLVRNIYRTHRYISNHHMAIAYGGLQDYRAKSGEIKTTLLLSDASASSFSNQFSGGIGR